MALKISEKINQMIPVEVMESINHEFYDQSFMNRELIVLKTENFEIDKCLRTELLGKIIYDEGYTVCYVVISWEHGEKAKLLYTQRISDRFFQELKHLTKGDKSQWNR